MQWLGEVKTKPRVPSCVCGAVSLGVSMNHPAQSGLREAHSEYLGLLQIGDGKRMYHTFLDGLLTCTVIEKFLPLSLRSPFEN